jgi:trimethylamine:corrinoid methyltransferase-like protein
MAIRPLRSTFTLEVLTDAQVEKVKNATLQVLDEIGVQIRSNQLLAELGRAGARTDEATSTARGEAPIVRQPPPGTGIRPVPRSVSGSG